METGQHAVAHGRVHGVVVFAGALVAAALVAMTPAGDRMGGLLADASSLLARRLPSSPIAPADEPVVVGVDEASLDEAGVPLALMHARLGLALEAIASAHPAVIGLDIALPAGAFDGLPGQADRALIPGLLQGLQAAAQGPGLVVALDVAADGSVRIPAAAWLAGAGGEQAYGLPLFPTDADGVVRRYAPVPGDAGVPAFVLRMARRLRHGADLEHAGWIAFARGAVVTPLSLRQVLAWRAAGDATALRAHFEGRAVLVGALLPFLDRQAVPVALVAGGADDATVPGVVLNAQVLRAGLLRDAGGGAAGALAVAAAALALVEGSLLRWLLLALALPLVVLLGALAQGAAWHVDTAPALVAALGAVPLRAAVDLAQARAAQARLWRGVAGLVSPQLMHTLVQGTIAAAPVRRDVAVLFADLRDFTQRSETRPADEVYDTLNRYFAAVTPVLHAHGGTIDNFRGDGLLVLFGAPEPSNRPCAQSLDALLGLHAAVARLNREELAPRGIAPLAVTAGLAAGEVIFGPLGSADRRDFTALGDAVNVAARLQVLARERGCAALATGAWVAGLDAPRADLQDLGPCALRGHSPVHLWVWNAPGA